MLVLVTENHDGIVVENQLETKDKCSNYSKMFPLYRAKCDHGASSPLGFME